MAFSKTKTQFAELDLSNSPGVSDFKGRFRLQFKLPDKAKAVRRSTGLYAVQENLKTVEITLGCIKRDIANGSYGIDPDGFWQRHFPHSATRIEEEVTVEQLFINYINEVTHQLSYSMLCKLNTCLNWLKIYKLAHLNICDIDHHKLNKLRKDSLITREVSTIKEYSQTFRRVIGEAVNDEIIPMDPFLKVRKLKKDSSKEDEYVAPFNSTELNALLNVIHIPQTKTMVELLAWTGLRPGELKALAWEDVHLKISTCKEPSKQIYKGHINVKYNIDRKGKLKTPKTKAGVRKVDLLPVSVKLLIEQKKISFDLPVLTETVYYINNKTKLVTRRRVFVKKENKPYIRPELTTTPKQWHNWLKEAGISHRPSYQLRHTYASKMIMKGANHMWLARQMGHTDWGMIRVIYATWIEEEGEDEINRLALAFGQQD